MILSANPDHFELVVEGGNLLRYDSFASTGMVGIKNQFSICFMSVCLQNLFCIGAIRKGMFALPTATWEKLATKPANFEVAVGIQRVFYQMQTSKHAVGIEEFTKFLGPVVAQFRSIFAPFSLHFRSISHRRVFAHAAGSRC